MRIELRIHRCPSPRPPQHGRGRMSRTAEETTAEPQQHIRGVRISVNPPYPTKYQCTVSTVNQASEFVFQGPIGEIGITARQLDNSDAFNHRMDFCPRSSSLDIKLWVSILNRFSYPCRWVNLPWLEEGLYQAIQHHGFISACVYIRVNKKHWE